MDLEGNGILDKQKKGHRRLSLPKGSRSLHIGDDIWYWKYISTCVSGGSLIILHPASRKKHCITGHTFKGVTPTVAEEDQWNHDFQITPSEVKEYIETHLLKS